MFFFCIKVGIEIQRKSKQAETTLILFHKKGKFF